MAKHDELLQQGPHEAPEPETADEMRKRIARPVGIAVTLAGVGAAIVFASEFLRFFDNDWWVGPLYLAVTVAGLVWGSRRRIREWWENQP